AVRRIREFAPDLVIVTDDKRRFLLRSALEAAPERVVLVLQTIVQLPFGPLAVCEDAKQTELMHRARAVFVISEFQRSHIRAHCPSLAPRMIRLPVYGPGPFPMLGRFDKGFVTLINPCDLKGAPIFLALARLFPNVEFAAVPTWGASDQMLAELRQLPNVRIIPPADDIEQVVRQTRVLLAP